ncbi:MAG: aspartate/glutamate racemase family protein [Woeseiaceae bacterium]
MSQSQKIVGVLGGMGPDATVDFMAKVIAMTEASCDQDHVRMLVDHNPHVPNRQEAILGDGEDPGPVLGEMAAALEARGADFLVIPCNTAYVFEDAILEETRIPLISIITESVAAVTDAVPAATSVGLLATDGCLRAGIYQDGIEAAGMAAVLPTATELDEIMVLVNAIKAGRQDHKTGVVMSKLAAALVSRGADAIIAGCTEIPLVLGDGTVRVPLIPSTAALALKTVKLATGEEPLPSRHQ